ncbi:hypothetical protein I9T54_07440, partial [Campylobacter peloridis]|nr:hypothetical protein [Campylobacter peloridis]
INANRFVASTSSMSNEDMQAFANMKTFEQGASFSPVFKPNPKGGNVINMGNINANDVLLIGNKVLIQGYLNTKDKTFNQIKAIDEGKKANIHLVGNEIYADIATFKDIGKLYITAKDKGSLYLNATGYYYNPSSFKDFDFIVKNYNGINHNNTNFSNMKYVGIGSDVDWWHFAKGWNEYNNDFITIANEYRLINDIDFQANCKNGVCTGQNYANYWIDLNGDGIKQDNEFTSMIVGKDYNGFTKNFDGQGYTLKNINTDTTKLDNKLYDVGIFGYAINATFKNINVDYMGGKINTNNAQYIGGFAGRIFGTSFTNISLSNIENISVNNILFRRQSFVGGFIGHISFGGTFLNISLNNIGNIENNNDNTGHNYAGGFAGFSDRSASAVFSNISLNNIGNISNSANGLAGGFIGIATDSEFSNISLNNIGNISGHRSAGGFAGTLLGGRYTNIYLNNIGNIINYNTDTYGGTGGFTGTILLYAGDSKFENIFIFFNPNTKMIYKNGSPGKFIGKIESTGTDNYNFSFNNIHIYHHKNDLANAINDNQLWNKINIHTYNDS